ncbi:MULTISPECIES: tyrosine-type recombinase/integrase [Chryseobacterium]|uniref:Integrase n=1 Tax=Chryseobacterium geocarposphaerae TaxID=1416776 RepID=A0ABU1LD87_9FLAO|nr:MULTISPECIES: tyrosine-type recombinase/integrase [Chryseobacterium]MDR6404570.1 integrase [Chryseobacterium geocarposphaerae]MDR6698198.1 integrase [Chryseobacterium ginsenosidimutans]
MATIRYYLRTKSANSKIQIQLSISRDLKLRTSTDLVVNHLDWSSDTNLPKQNNPENKILTRQLRELSNHLLNEYNSDFVAGVIFDTNWLKEKLNKYFRRIDEKEDDSIFVNYLGNFIDFKKGIASYTDSTIGKYNNLKDRFSEYQKKKKKNFLIEDLSGKVLIDFKNYLIVDCGLMETTATRFIKNLKTVIFDSRNNGKQIHHQIAGFSTGTTNSEHKVFLSLQEIGKIKEIVTLNADWNLAKDWLILGCYLGQRASDLLRMTKRMIYTKTDADGNSFRFIEIKQQKTGEKVVIPLHDEVEEILKKYNGDFPPVFANNPDSNSVLFNRHIKKVCELAGIHDMVKGKYFNEVTKKNEIVETEKCKLVSSHVCRRSFATNFYGNKMFTTPQLMAITGHKSEAQFLNYIGRTADDWAMQTAKTFKELSNQKIS